MDSLLANVDLSRDARMGPPQTYRHEARSRFERKWQSIAERATYLIFHKDQLNESFIRVAPCFQATESPRTKIPSQVS